MKYLLFAILENTENCQDLLKELSMTGFNGTVIPTASLTHTLLNSTRLEEEPFFGTLRHLVENKFEGNTTLYMVLDEEKLVIAKKIIRDVTRQFTLTRGGMFEVALAGYEGSF